MELHNTVYIEDETPARQMELLSRVINDNLENANSSLFLNYHPIPFCTIEHDLAVMVRIAKGLGITVI